MPGPRIISEPPIVPQVHCPACLARMRLTSAETKHVGELLLTYYCDACKADVVRPFALKQA